MAGFRYKPDPAPEVTRFFDQKALKPAFHYRDVLPEEHAIAFTVAKAVKTEILADIRAAVSKAIKTGETLDQFRKELEPRLQALGWWGRQDMTDPKTGETLPVQLGSPRRLKTIYWANTRTARAAGLWERAQRTKRVAPYFLYRLGPSENHRPHHVSKAGTVLPVDHPFWDTWFPPNGWGCKCWIRQVGEDEARELGGVSEPPEIPTRDMVNRRTGQVEHVPQGIDPGWTTNPGKVRARSLVQHFNARIEEAGADAPAVAKAVISDLWASDAPRAYAQMPERVHLPVAFVPGLARRLDARSPLVVVSNDTIAAKARKHAAIDLTRFGLVQEMVETGTAIDMRKEGRGINVWMERDGAWFRAALRLSAEGFLYLATLFRSDRARFEAQLRRFGIWERGDRG